MCPLQSCELGQASRREKVLQELSPPAQHSQQRPQDTKHTVILDLGKHHARSSVPHTIASVFSYKGLVSELFLGIVHEWLHACACRSWTCKVDVGQTMKKLVDCCVPSCEQVLVALVLLQCLLVSTCFAGMSLSFLFPPSVSACSAGMPPGVGSRLSGLSMVNSLKIWRKDVSFVFGALSSERNLCSIWYDGWHWVGLASFYGASGATWYDRLVALAWAFFPHLAWWLATYCSIWHDGSRLKMCRDMASNPRWKQVCNKTRRLLPKIASLHPS